MEMKDDNKITDMKKRPPSEFGDSGWLSNTFFMRLTARDVFGVVKYHPIPCIFATTLFFFMGVEYTLHMVPSSSPPFDLGFIATRPLHRLLDSKPALNTVLAGLNTVLILNEMVTQLIPDLICFMHCNVFFWFCFTICQFIDSSPMHTGVCWDANGVHSMGFLN